MGDVSGLILAGAVLLGAVMWFAVWPVVGMLYMLGYLS